MSAEPECMVCGDYIYFGPVLCKKHAKHLQAEIARLKESVKQWKEVKKRYQSSAGKFLAEKENLLIKNKQLEGAVKKAVNELNILMDVLDVGFGVIAHISQIRNQLKEAMDDG